LDAHYDKQQGLKKPHFKSIAATARRLDAAHVFNDGTGRVKRLVTNMLLTQAGGIPVTIPHTNLPTERSDEEYADFLCDRQNKEPQGDQQGETDVNRLNLLAAAVSDRKLEIKKSSDNNDYIAAIMAERILPEEKKSLLKFSTSKASRLRSKDNSNLE